MALRDATDDLTVAEACERASKALVDGAADVSDLPALAALFVDGGTLGAVVRSARAALEGDATPEQLEQAAGALERELSPIAETGLYLDDEDRRLSLLQLGRRARVLQPRGRRRRAACAARPRRVLRRALLRVARAHDARAPPRGHRARRRAHARGAGDARTRRSPRCTASRRPRGSSRRPTSSSAPIGVCPVRAGAGHLLLSARLHGVEARQERPRRRLLPSAPSRCTRTSPVRREASSLTCWRPAGRALRALDDDEVVPALERGEIPAGDLGALRARAGDAAGACVDAGLFSVARPLMGAYLELGRDDALLDVYRSLARP